VSNDCMIPQDWIPHRRARDEELVGYLVPQGDNVLPVTLFGYPLGTATDAADARQVLESTGLSVLAEPWELTLADGETIRVRIREVSADQVVVFADDFGFGGNLGDAYVLEVPELGRLRR
jgi:hypothetical protein